MSDNTSNYNPAALDDLFGEIADLEREDDEIDDLVEWQMEHGRARGDGSHADHRARDAARREEAKRRFRAGMLLEDDGRLYFQHHDSGRFGVWRPVKAGDPEQRLNEATGEIEDIPGTAGNRSAAGPLPDGQLEHLTVETPHGIARVTVGTVEDGKPTPTRMDEAIDAAMEQVGLFVSAITEAITEAIDEGVDPTETINEALTGLTNNLPSAAVVHTNGENSAVLAAGPDLTESEIDRLRQARDELLGLRRIGMAMDLPQDEVDAAEAQRAAEEEARIEAIEAIEDAESIANRDYDMVSMEDVFGEEQRP